MITADSERSRKRIPTAKKALDLITGLDLPAKASMIDGFSYRVWQLNEGELTGGRVTSPDGIFILCATGNRLKQFVCDSFEVGAAPVFSTADGGRHVLAPAVLPTPSDSYKTALGGLTADARTVVAKLWYNTRPLCLPFAGEGVLAATASLFYDGTVTADLASVQVTNCLSSGQNDVSSPGISQFIGKFTRPLMTRPTIVPTYLDSGTFEYIQWIRRWQLAELADDGAGGEQVDFIPVVRRRISAGPTYGADTVSVRQLYPVAPTGYWAVVSRLYDGTPASATQYAHVISLGAAVTRTDGVIALYTPIAIAGLDICGPALANPCPCVTADVEEYAVTLSFFKLGVTPPVTPTTIKFGALKPVLYGLLATEFTYLPTAVSMTVTNLAAPEPDDEGRAISAYILAHLFGGQADSSFFPGMRRNASTFSDAAGTVYSWLRSTDPTAAQTPFVTGYPGRARSGGFKFTPVAGIERAAIVMPPLVLANADMYPWVTGLTDTKYLCIVEDAATGYIASIYVGSPLVPVGWVEIPPPAGAELVVARPQDVTGAKFIAVGKIVVGVPPNEADEYYVFTSRAAPDPADPPIWTKMSRVPAGAVDSDARWDICVFGAGRAAATQQPRQFHAAQDW